MDNPRARAESFLSGGRSKARAFRDEDEPARKGFLVEDQPTAQSFSLCVYSQDGNTTQAFAWALFNGYEWKRDDGIEKLTMLFGKWAVFIEGRHLDKAVIPINTCRLKGLQCHNSVEAMKLDTENDGAPHDERQEVILTVEIKPSFQSVVDDLTSPNPEEEILR